MISGCISHLLRASEAVDSILSECADSVRCACMTGASRERSLLLGVAHAA